MSRKGSKGKESSWRAKLSLLRSRPILEGFRKLFVQRLLRHPKPSCLERQAPFTVDSQGTYPTASELLVYKLSLHAVRSATKIIQMRRDIEHNPRKHLSNTLGGVKASSSQPPDPHWQAFPTFILQVGCCFVFVSIGPRAEHIAT